MSGLPNKTEGKKTSATSMPCFGSDANPMDSQRPFSPENFRTVTINGTLGNRWNQYLGVSENVVYPIVPNGYCNDHYPVFKWLFHWED